MTFLDTFMKAQRLVDSKQNRENAISLVGTDKQGDEHFLQWLDKDMTINDLIIPDHVVKLRALAGTKLA